MEVQAQQNAKRLRLLVRKWVSLNAMSLSFMLLVSLSYCALSFYLLKEPFFIYFVNLVLSKIYRAQAASLSDYWTRLALLCVCTLRSRSSSSGKHSPAFFYRLE